MSEAVRIRSIAAGGDGVGTLGDGRTVFAPRTAPGDLAELTVLTLAKRFARARLERVTEPSPDRVRPPCPHYEKDDCGGCQLQHLHADAQRTVRRRLVADAMQRIGRLEAAEPPLEASDREWEYRTKISLAVRGPVIGYHKVGRPDQIFDLRRCPIARPELNQLWTALRANRRLFPKNATHIVLRIDRDGGRHAIVRVKGAEVWLGAREMGENLARAGVQAVLWWEPEGGAPRTVFGAREAYPAMVFEQVHPGMGDRVREYAVASLGGVTGKHVWDLYSGIGETTQALVAAGATVESVELDRRAVSVAEARGSRDGVTRHAGRVEDVLPRLRPPGAILVNPPRAGLGEDVTAWFTTLFSSSQPPAPSPLVYVSCDPATLARDIARLRTVCRVRDLRSFDLFPQTAHVETVARLELL
jgi:23S rRNA (uracil1939-C5)-methyltransferase